MTFAALRGPLANLKEVTGFLLMGGVAAAVNLIARSLLNAIMPFAAAVTVAYLLGMVVAFVLFQRVIFKAREGGANGRQIFRFCVVNIAALGQVVTISVLLADWVFPLWSLTWHAHDIAHFIGVLLPAISSYFGHKYYTFSEV